jgi:hypothetical protein
VYLVAVQVCFVYLVAVQVCFVYLVAVQVCFVYLVAVQVLCETESYFSLILTPCFSTLYDEYNNIKNVTFVKCSLPNSGCNNL